MTTPPTSTHVGAVLTKAGVSKPSEPHAERLARATKELTEAETLLKRGGAKPKRFLATFRIRDSDSATRGTSAQRREHLVTRIKALSGVQHHVSTSAWSCLTYHGAEAIVLNALKPAIDEALDYLEVVQTNPAPVKAGVSALKS